MEPTNDTIRCTASVEIEAAAGPDKPAKVRIMAYGGGMMRVPGFGPVIIDLASLVVPGDVVLLADHANEIAAIVGSGRPVVAGNKLAIEGTITKSTPAGQQVLQLAADGIKLGASVGVEIIARERLRPGDKATVNGKLHVADADGLLVVRGGVLKEVSLTPVPADPQSTVSISAKGTIMPNTSTTSDETTIRASERERLQEIDQCVGTRRGQTWGKDQRRVDELRASCIDGEISIDELRKNLLEILRASRPPVPAIVSGGDAPASVDVLQASMLLRLKCAEKVVAGWYGEPATHAATLAANRNLGLHDLLRLTMQAAGLTPPHRINSAVIRECFEADRGLRAGGGFSTISLPGILGNVANKTLLSAFEAVPATWRTFCAVGSNKDFKTAEKYRLSPRGHFEQIDKGGQIKHISLDEAKYESALQTHGSMITITREDIINDDLDALGALPAVLGRLSAIALDRAVFELLLMGVANGFFSVGKTNLVAGGGAISAVLQFDSLDYAEQLFLRQTDENGDSVLIQPKVLLVPLELSLTAAAMVTPTVPTIIQPAPDGSLFPAGPFLGRYRPITSPWLSNSNLPNSSTSGWFLFGDPNDMAAYEVAFLDGKETPTIESGDTDFSTLGMSWRAYFDFAVAQREYRAAVYSDGLPAAP